MEKKLTFDNNHEDIFVTDSTPLIGTRVDFQISTAATKKIAQVFNNFAGNEFTFDKTEIIVDFYKMKTQFVSRSQARQIFSGLDKFKTIILDFKKIETIGQGFADEVFRVWKDNNPKKNIEIRNANENVQFMIEHVKRNQSQ